MAKYTKLPKPIFRPLCYRSLVKSLGKSDATVEWIEVAIRHLVNEYHDFGTVHLQSLAQNCGIRVNIDGKNKSISELQKEWPKMQISAVHQMAEEFFTNFDDQHPHQIKAKRQDESLMSFTLRAYHVSRIDVGKLQYELVDYYREVRNCIMHKPTSSKINSLKLKRVQLHKDIENSIYSSLNAPNLINELTFDDFILFSRSLKHLAGKLCQATMPTDEEFINAVKSDAELDKRLSRLTNNKKRKKNLIAAYLRERYSLNDSIVNRLTNILGD